MIGGVTTYILYFTSVGLILWKREKFYSIWANFIDLELEIKEIIELKRYLKLTFLLFCLIITIFPFWSFYAVARLNLDSIPITQKDSLSYHCNTSNTFIYDNGTIITTLHPIYSWQGIFDDDLNSSHLIISHCLGDLTGDGMYTEMIGIKSINSTDPYTDVLKDINIFYLVNEEISLSCWKLVVSNNSVLQIKIDNQSLQVGEEVSLAFCIPSEESELLDFVITKFGINFILRDIVVQRSEGY